MISHFSLQQFQNLRSYFFFTPWVIFFFAFSNALADPLASFPPALDPPPPPPPPPLDASDALEVALATPADDDLLEGDSELPLSFPPFLEEVKLRPLGVVEPLEGLFSGELRC